MALNCVTQLKGAKREKKKDNSGTYLAGERLEEGSSYVLAKTSILIVTFFNYMRLFKTYYSIVL